MLRAVGGLGDNREDPTVLKTDIDRAYQVFMATMNHLPKTPSSDLVQRATILSNWFQSTFQAMATQNWHDARVKVDTIYGLLGDFAARVGQATVAGSTAQKEAEAGSSFLKQLGVTLGLSPAAGVYRPAVPGSTAGDLIGGTIGGAGALLVENPWLLPAGAGLLLFLLLRR